MRMHSYESSLSELLSMPLDPQIRIFSQKLFFHPTFIISMKSSRILDEREHDPKRRSQEMSIPPKPKSRYSHSS
jgi:hypothetical protein